MQKFTKYPYDENLATGYDDDGSFSSSDSQKFTCPCFGENQTKSYKIRDNGFSVQSMERYLYKTPYGKRKVMNAGYCVLSESGIGEEFGYTGERHDREATGLMYFRVRMYSVDSGRLVGWFRIAVLETILNGLEAGAVGTVI